MKQIPRLGFYERHVGLSTGSYSCILTCQILASILQWVPPKSEVFITIDRAYHLHIYIIQGERACHKSILYDISSNKAYWDEPFDVIYLGIKNDTVTLGWQETVRLFSTSESFHWNRAEKQDGWPLVLGDESGGHFSVLPVHLMNYG